MSDDYPLWCIEGNAPDDEERYRGPFDTKEKAWDAAIAEGLSGGFRRCRRMSIHTVLEHFDIPNFIDELDDMACSNPWGPKVWADWDEPIVEEREHAKEAFFAWANRHLQVNVFECEPKKRGQHDCP